jgi:hypothetical protein
MYVLISGEPVIVCAIRKINLRSLVGVATGTIYTALSERLDDLRKEDQRKDDFDPALAGKGLQRIDVEYSSYDFSKEEDLTIYFSKVGTCLIGSMKIKEEWDQYVKGRAIQMKAFESRPELIQLRQDHHESFREAMEKIHNIIMQNNDPSETAKAVLKLWLNCFIVYEDFLDKVRQVLVNSEGLEGDTYEIIG